MEGSCAEEPELGTESGTGARRRRDKSLLQHKYIVRTGNFPNNTRMYILFAFHFRNRYENVKIIILFVLKFVLFKFPFLRLISNGWQ